MARKSLLATGLIAIIAACSIGYAQSKTPTLAERLFGVTNAKTAKDSKNRSSSNWLKHDVDANRSTKTKSLLVHGSGEPTPAELGPDAGLTQLTNHLEPGSENVGSLVEQLVGPRAANRLRAVRKTPILDVEPTNIAVPEASPLTELPPSAATVPITEQPTLKAVKQPQTVAEDTVNEQTSVAASPNPSELVEQSDSSVVAKPPPTTSLLVPTPAIQSDSVFEPAADQPTESESVSVLPATEPVPSLTSRPLPKSSLPESVMPEPLGITTQLGPVVRAPTHSAEDNTKPFRIEARPPAAAPVKVPDNQNSRREGPSLPSRSQQTRSPKPTVEPKQVEDPNLLITNQSPALSVATAGPRTMVVGKSASYVVRVNNTSEHSARNVVVSVTVPSWAEILDSRTTSGSTRLEPTQDGNSVVKWQLNQLGARDAAKMRLNIVPRDSRPFDLSVGWTFSPASAMAHIQVQEPKLDMDIVGPQDMLFGETKIYTITVSNPGTGDAENVVLSLMPLVPGDGPAGVRKLGLMKAGTRKIVEIELTARQSGNLKVRANATADGGLRTNSEQHVIVRRADLQVALAGPEVKYAGTPADYTLRVANVGDATASNVTVYTVLPAGAKLLASSDGAQLDNSNSRVTWQVGNLRPGAVKNLHLQAELISAGNNRLEVRARADKELSATQSIVTAVESLADLKLIVDDPKGAVPVGTNCEYMIRVVNRGTKAAEHVNVVAYFSEGIEPLSAQGWRADIDSGQVVFESIRRLGPGQEMVFKVTAQAERSGNHVLRAELECSEPETRLATEEWTRFYGQAAQIEQLPERSVSNALLGSQPAPPQRLEIRR